MTKKVPAVMPNTCMMLDPVYTKKMLLKEAPIVALKATKSKVKVEELMRCSPKFMAKMKANGAKVTAQPNMLMPPMGLNNMEMAPLVAKYHAIAPVTANPPAIQPNTAFIKPLSSATIGMPPVGMSEARWPPLKMRGGSCELMPASWAIPIESDPSGVDQTDEFLPRFGIIKE